MPHKNIMGKAICSVCKGNGFIRDKESNTDIKKQTIKQCSACNSEGEIVVTHQNLQNTLWGSSRK